MITLQNLNYRYKSGLQALHNVNAEITPGIHLLLGENGAGKTTLLHTIAGLRTATPASSCLIDGTPSALRLPSVQQKVFVITDEMAFPFPTIRDMVRLHACFYPNFDKEMLAANLQSFGISDSDPIDSFSLGNRKKAYLAYALALQTEVLLLDEPANGLDISAKRTLLQMLSQCVAENQTVIISTHTVWDFQSLFDSVMMLRQGTMILSMPVWTISERISFVSDTFPIEGAIYTEPLLGRFHAIVPNTSGQPSDLNYTLLYSALQSPKAQDLLNVLNQTPQQQ